MEYLWLSKIRFIFRHGLLIFSITLIQARGITLLVVYVNFFFFLNAASTTSTLQRNDVFPFGALRFTNQKSLPVYMKKDKFYYMEAVMKDDHQKDHLEAAVKTPDGQFYKVIPSKFLWTTLPPPPGWYILK